MNYNDPTLMFIHTPKIPTNDSGISFGQVMVVNALIAKGMSRVVFIL